MAGVYPIRVRVHEKGDRRLDGILRLIEEAGRPRPLPEVLQTLCAAIAEIARADVVSVYLREPAAEGGDVLVMRANVGFPNGAVGQVRLAVGEGLTGFVAECLRPLSLAVGRADERYKHVPGLGEEHYPSYLGVPLLVGGTAAGVLVLQRREAHELAPAEVALATALAAPVAYAIERAAARAEERHGAAALPANGRTARLAGVVPAATLAAPADGPPAGVGARGGSARGEHGRWPAAVGPRPDHYGARAGLERPGLGLGRAELLPGLDELAARAPAVLPKQPPPDEAVVLALSSLARELDRSRRRLEHFLPGDALRSARGLALMLEDRRFRDLAVAECGHVGVVSGLRKVAREYARAAFLSAEGDQAGWLEERAAEVEDLCLLAGARALRVRLFPAGAIVIAERITCFLALALACRRAEGVALAGRANGMGPVIARAAGLPVVAEVAGLFAWVRPGDRVLVDEENALVRVNPPETAVARFRARTRA